jgi:hypothetical protein
MPPHQSHVQLGFTVKRRHRSQARASNAPERARFTRYPPKCDVIIACIRKVVFLRFPFKLRLNRWRTKSLYLITKAPIQAQMIVASHFRSGYLVIARLRITFLTRESEIDMVHLANAGPRAKGSVFFNIDHPVGQGPGVEPGVSRSVDVQLVQLFLKVLGFYNLPGGGFTGLNDSRTIDAIIQFQLNHTSPKPDGRISVARGESFGSNSTFAIVTLNRLVREKQNGTWPRIHRFPGLPVPPLLFNRVTEILGVS